jgi:hypothetical protein
MPLVPKMSGGLKPSRSARRPAGRATMTGITAYSDTTVPTTNGVAPRSTANKATDTRLPANPMCVRKVSRTTM